MNREYHNRLRDRTRGSLDSTTADRCVLPKRELDTSLALRKRTTLRGKGERARKGDR